MDNVPTHTSDFILEVANLLNIYLLPLPEYSPELNPIKRDGIIQNYILKRKTINTTEELIDYSIELYGCHIC